MVRDLSFSILLFLIGLLGSSFPVFFNRDGASLIIIGFGTGILLVHSRIKEGNIVVKNPSLIKILTIAAFLVGIGAMVYNAYRFNTNFNRVLTVGFVILLIWEVILVFSTIKPKSKK